LELDARRRSGLRAAAEWQLRENWREGVHPRAGEYAYTCPSTPRYRHQWYWDSCFHAIVWSHFDPARARAELRTLLRAGRADGFVPHTAFWDRPAGWRRAPFYATASLAGDLATESIQTPLIAVAWERVAAASEDEPGFALEGLPALERHYDWLERERDPDGDGLISVILPDESGLDDSPKYDAVFGWRAHWTPGYFSLVERSRRLGYRARSLAERSDMHAEDVLVNVAYALALESLARMRGEGPGGRYESRARKTVEAVCARMYDRSTGLFFDLAGRRERPVRLSTWSALAPLALASVPDDMRRRLVEEHLLDGRRYRAPTGIPSVSMEERSFTARFDFWRTWRGPSWMCIAWLLVPAMRELGYRAEAARVVDSLAAAVERHGWREYYNPLSGRGEAARGFGPSTLLVDLLQEPAM
jgi:hypothetical protein